MTTSDDEPTFGGDPYLEATTHAEPLDGEAVVAVDERPRWVPAILASLGAIALGCVLWSVIFVGFDREYPGVAVVIALAVGWLMRVVSRRDTMPVRVVAVLLTAFGCVAGTLVSQSAWGASEETQPEAGFFELLKDATANVWEVMTKREGITLAIFGAALVLAYLSAAPQKPPKKKTAAADAVPATYDDDLDAEDAPPTDEE